MTNDPDQPFQPPRPPSQPPFGQGPPPAGGGSGEGTGGSAFGGVMLGLGLGLFGPPLIGGLLAWVLASGGAPATVQVLFPLAMAVIGTVAIFLTIITKLDKNSPQQAALRTAMVVTGYISLAFWAVGVLLVGVCFALLAGAY